MKKANIVPILGIALLVALIITSAANKILNDNEPEYMFSGNIYTPESPTHRPSVSVTSDPMAGISIGRQNAIKSASAYLRVSSFSRKGLVDQLRFEGYSSDEAVFACDYLEPDWYAEAAEAAASYLRVSSFSSQGLIDQLLFEGFTEDEAAYGVAAVGY